MTTTSKGQPGTDMSGLSDTQTKSGLLRVSATPTKSGKADVCGASGASAGREPLGLYVHIPFCLQKCRYCDFYSEGGHDQAVMASYIEALMAEAAWYGGQEALGGRVVDTVFLGGGTPSLLPPALTEALLGALRRTFSIAEDGEITVECNPATLTEEKLAAYRRAGVNRLSIGVQSMDPSVLAVMGRVHSPEDVVRTVEAARRAGFWELNLDVMFGVPGQTRAVWTDTLDRVLALEPPHLSFYSLEVAEGTPLAGMLADGRLTETAAEEDRWMYHHLLDRLAGAGYEQYEISNGAKPGHRCRHNLKYWDLRDYLGLGAAAHSYLQGLRFSNVPDLRAYTEALSATRAAHAAVDITGAGLWPRLSPAVSWQAVNSHRDDLTDFAFTALRRIEGIEKAAFAQRFGEPFWTAFSGAKEDFDRFAAQGLASDSGGRVRITRAGMDIANRIIELFL